MLSTACIWMSMCRVYFIDSLNIFGVSPICSRLFWTMERMCESRQASEEEALGKEDVLNQGWAWTKILKLQGACQSPETGMYPVQSADYNASDAEKYTGRVSRPRQTISGLMSCFFLGALGSQRRTLSTRVTSDSCSGENSSEATWKLIGGARLEAPRADG